MSDQGGEGQVPEPPGLEGRGEMPPRPTVRESFRRGLFVRLPTEDDAEGVAGSEQGQGIADQYPEQVADPYPGWRQAADGSWEAVSPEAITYVESTEPAAPEPAYPEIDQSANFASVAGGEPFIHDEAAADAPAWTFASEQDFSQVAEGAVVPVTETPPEATDEAAPAAEDSVAGTGLYIPSDVELLEGDMPLYGEKENGPPRFAGSGLGEPCFIEFADLARTLTGLRRLLPKGTRLTYNYDFERAWIRSSEGIDLPSFAERIEAPAAEGEKASS